MMSRLRPRLFLLRGLVVAAVTLAVLVAGAARANDSIEEARVKAAFVLNFIKFTSWPDGQGEATPTLTLCVIGGYALAGQLNAPPAATCRAARCDCSHWKPRVAMHNATRSSPP